MNDQPAEPAHTDHEVPILEVASSLPPPSFAPAVMAEGGRLQKELDALGRALGEVEKKRGELRRRRERVVKQLDALQSFLAAAGPEQDIPF